MHNHHHQSLPPLLLILILVALTLAACGTTTSRSTDSASSDIEDTESSQQSPTNSATEPQGPPDAAGGNASSSDTTPLIAFQNSLVDSSDTSELSKGASAPDFSYTFPDGTTHTLSDLEGKKVMINFWATWCPPCKAEMPDIQEAANRFEDDGFVVLAISQDIEPDLVKPFAEEYQLTIPLIVDDDHEIGSRYGARGLPTSYFINTDGTIHDRVTGMVNVDRIAAYLEAMN
jgi:peroxiredoxin